ncbi:achelase-2-like [Symsagittifera roscoffensis]|uniref:achelase-2-like n=1 Tax=Symsagittifera roscoffensis TaxID=84072 RepID=UPI00307CA31E
MNISMGNITAGDRITGGSKARVTDYAFYARVIIDKRYCGGTIINTLEVVTAAHCVFNDNAMKWFQPGQIEVRTGDFTLTKTTQVDIKKSQKHSVMQFQYLDQYRGNPIIGYDFVVLRLSSMIHFDKYRKALEPCTGFTANSRGNSLMAVGLGYTDGVRQTKAITLMKVALTEVNAVMCETAYPGNSAPKRELRLHTRHRRKRHLQSWLTCARLNSCSVKNLRHQNTPVLITMSHQIGSQMEVCDSFHQATESQGA